VSAVRVLVTGSAGFIGSWALGELAKRGYETIGTDKTMAPNLIQTDITDLKGVLQLFDRVKPDAVVHLAAISGSTGKNEAEQSLRQPQENFNVNILGTANICEASRKTGVKEIIYMSSFAVYGRTLKDRLPISPSTPVLLEHAYANSKYMGELVVKTYSQDFGLKSTIFRAPFVSGEYQRERSVLMEFIESASQGKDLVIFGKGEHVREFVHPIDVVGAFMRAMSHMEKSKGLCETFVLGNTPIKIKELAQLVIQKVGKGNVKYVEQAVDRAFDQYSDYSKATQELGWKPTISVSEIVDRIIASDFR
jgi:UDP-glucose 4-epimerase